MMRMKGDENRVSYSIVVPFHNEQDNVPQLYVKIIDATDSIGARYEMVFMDDGSEDETLRQLSEIVQHHRKETQPFESR